jgi:hypothetical protein
MDLKKKHLKMLKKNKCYHISDASCEVTHWHGINHLIDYRKELETFYDALIETIMEDLIRMRARQHNRMTGNAYQKMQWFKSDLLKMIISELPEDNPLSSPDNKEYADQFYEAMVTIISEEIL